eukprot:4213514-Pleurochrysis_carterae.AAC.1
MQNGLTTHTNCSLVFDYATRVLNAHLIESKSFQTAAEFIPNVAAEATSCTLSRTKDHAKQYYRWAARQPGTTQKVD